MERFSRLPLRGQYRLGYLFPERLAANRHDNQDNQDHESLAEPPVTA
jgi:hypothetical protein